LRAATLVGLSVAVVGGWALLRRRSSAAAPTLLHAPTASPAPQLQPTPTTTTSATPDPLKLPSKTTTTIIAPPSPNQSAPANTSTTRARPALRSPRRAQSQTPDPFEALRVLALQRTNQLRAQVGAPPLSRKKGNEACADRAIQFDSTRKPHASFGQCGEAAQNEGNGFGQADEKILNDLLSGMFGEGPSSTVNHYMNMTNRKYHSMSAGFFKDRNGRLWFVSNFYG
jgi:uncharacterized protein YkwD